jgi:group I intron endonuclease
MAYIYCIKNNANNKCYIGTTKSKNVNSRWNQHKNSIEKKGGCRSLKNAFKKYGVHNFTFKILIICFEEDMYLYEKEYTKKRRSVCLYNT